MKKLIFSGLWLILFSVYFLLIPQKSFTMAAVTEVSCNARCQFSYGVNTSGTDWQGKEISGSQCSKECPVCRTKQLNLESAQVMGMDCQYTDTCYCFAEDFKSVHEGGSEQIVDYAEPLVDDVTIETLADKINNAIPIAMGLGGVIAFILIVFGAFQIILSGGNPDRVKAGKEMITSAIAGLLLIVFSILILKLIGQDILDIPGFGSE